MPSPPNCLPTGDVVCEEDDNSPVIKCDTPCFGNLVDGQILCECQ